MYVSAIRVYPGLELKKNSLERVVMVSIEDFSGLDDAEGGFERWLYPFAGIGRAHRRCKTIAVTGERCSPYRKDGDVIDVSLLI